MEQQELFIINDINMSINPSDIQVMEDNWVIGDSYLRSKAVYCFRSQYSATKVVLQIPFEITYLTLESEASLNNTYNCIKLASELSSYPYCFIKNERIRNYIAPTSQSTTGFMMFAVSELGFVQDQSASNMVFLEVVLQYYDYTALIEDFMFRSNLEVTESEEVGVQIVDNLANSQVWRQYMSPKINQVYEKLTTYKLLDMVTNSNGKVNPMLRVDLLVPLMSEISENGENLDDGKLVSDTAKVIKVTDTSSFDNGSFESTLMTITNQDFSGNTVAVKTEETQKLNDTQTIKNSQTMTKEEFAKYSQDKKNGEQGESNSGDTFKSVVGVTTNPFAPENKEVLNVQAPYAIDLGITAKNIADRSIDDLNKITSTEGSKEIFIDWKSENIQEMFMGVQKIEIRRKNRIATHQIASVKHPVVQYMGKYPTTCNITMVGVNFDIYKTTDGDSNTNTFIKHMLNVLDYNRAAFPEAEGYNYLRIHSLGTALFGCEAFLPGQSVVVASANSQGLESIVYSFSEGDLSSFIEDGVVEASGKQGLNKGMEDVRSILRTYLWELTQELPPFIDGREKEFDAVAISHKFTILQLYAELGQEMAKELGFNKFEIYNAFKLGYDLRTGLKPNANYMHKVKPIQEGVLKGFVDINTQYYGSPLQGTISSPTPLNEKRVSTPGYVGGILGGVPEHEEHKTDYSNTVEVGLWKIYSTLVPLYLSMFNIRSDILSGKGSNVPNITFNESANVNRLISLIVSKISSGMNNGLGTASDKLTEEQKKTLQTFSSDLARTFLGYNIQDLDLHNLVDNYDEKTDTTVSKISPFFFLKEFKHVNDEELVETFRSIYDTQKIDDGLMAVADKGKGELAPTDPNSAPSIEADAEQQYPIVGLTYRRLQEIPYTGPKANVSGIAAALGSASPLGLALTAGAFAADLISKFKANGDNSNKKAAAGKVPTAVSDGLEKALKHYGLENDQNFRQLMYNLMLIESGNDPSSKSGTGALGPFQITEVAMAQMLIENNKVVFSDGTALPKNLSLASANSVAAKYKSKVSTDYFYAAQLFIEHVNYLSKKGNLIKDSSGKVSPVYLYVAYNLGEGAGESVIKAMKTGNISDLDDTGYKAIRDQGDTFKTGDKGSSLKKYTSFIVDTLILDNIPPDIKSATAPKEQGTTVVDSVTGADSKVIVDKATAVLNKQVAAEEKAKTTNKPTSAIVPVAADKLASKTSTTSFKGVVQEVKDGDTVTVLNVKTNEKVDVRLSSLDAPEIAHSKDEKGELYSQQSKVALDNLLKGKEVTVEPNGTSGSRVTGQVTLPDGTDASLAMIRNGYGSVSPNYVVNAVYMKAEAEAISKKAGMWSLPQGLIVAPRSKALTEAQKKKVIERSGSDPTQGKRAVTDKEMYAAQKYENGSKLSVVPKHIHNKQPFEGGKTYKITRTLRADGDSNGKHGGIDIGSPEGVVVIAAAGGKVKHRFQGSGTVGTGYGRYLDIDHGNGLVSRYAHLLKYLVADGAIVKYGTPIALSGGKTGGNGAGTSRAAVGHLHYEVMYKGSKLDPFLIRPLDEYTGEFGSGAYGSYTEGDYNSMVSTLELTDELPVMTITREGVTEENTVFNEGKLGEAIVRTMVKNINRGLEYSLPSLKVYMTVGNENDSFLLDSLKGGIQYYELKGIQNFHMNCNNDNNPVDTVMMSVANPSFLNTDAFMGIKKLQGVNTNAIGTDFETQFRNNRIQVKNGTKLHIRLGYGNDPNKLPIVFNGTVVNVSERAQNLDLVCESFGKELLSEVLAPNKPTFLNSQSDNISTSMVIGECLGSKHIEHFGYNSGFLADKVRASTDPEDRTLSPDTFSFSYNWGFNLTSPAQFKSRLFMNVFAPEIEHLEDEYSKYKGWISWFLTVGSNHATGYPFAVFKMTPWACLKQMEYRHPNTICKPIMYEDRVSLFYGIKEQFCFRKDLNREFRISAAAQKEGDGGYDLTDYYTNSRTKRLEPAVNIHMASSGLNLISNGVHINSEYKTAINVMYTKDETPEGTTTQPWDLELFKSLADDNLYPWDTREKDLNLSGCIGRYSAFLYGTTELKKEAEKMYSGKIFILGNSDIRAGDYIFIDDSIKRMSGLMLVRECYHHFDESHGFVTEIVPGQYVEAANFLYSSLWLKLMCTAKIGATKLKKIVGTSYGSEDFNMVYDYLTVTRQAELALKDYNKNQFIDNAAIIAINGSLSLMMLKVLNNISKIVGIGSQSAPLRNRGINFGTSLHLPKNLYAVFKNRIHMKIFDAGADVTKFLYQGSKLDTAISTRAAKIGSTKYFKKLLETKKAAQATKVGWLASKGYGAGRLLFKAGLMLGRVILGTMVGLLMTNPLGILVDIVATYIVMWAFAKVEENNLTRQPLLYYPVIKSGKPYVGGMAGVIRNSWMDSKATEWGKTWKEIHKSADILAQNGEARGEKEKLFVKLAKSFSNNSEDSKARAPSYVTDSTGQSVTTVSKPKTTVVATDKKIAAAVTDPETKRLLAEAEAKKAALIKGEQDPVVRDKLLKEEQKQLEILLSKTNATTVEKIAKEQ